MKVRYSNRLAAAIVVAINTPQMAVAQSSSSTSGQQAIDEIVVSGAFRTTAAETLLPIRVLSGDEYRQRVTNSLGDTLKNEVGLNSASYGTGVGQPIVRGQTGNRVAVLQNGIALTDVANQSPDHGNSLEPLLADGIEIVRGPSTLLYGSGAIGGVVNVIDSRIPEQLVDQTNFQLEQNYNSVNEEDKTVFRLDSSFGNFGVHLDYFTRENENVEIDGFAIDEGAVEGLEALTKAYMGDDHDDHDDNHDDHDDDHDDHDDDHDDHDDEMENTNGFIGNSNGEAEGGAAGFSFVGDQGFFGFAYSNYESDYGLPPGTHSHAHGDEHGDEHDDHDDDHDDHDDDHDAHGGEEVEFVRLKLDQDRYDFRGEYRFVNSWIDSIRGSVGITDYQHEEIEYFEDGDSHVGTLYSNEGYNSRFTLNRAPTGNWSGVYGLQIRDSEFSAVGEEAFIAPSDIRNVGWFGVERYSNGDFTGELGFRFESADVDPGRCGYDDSVYSLSASGLYGFGESSNFLVGVSRSERAPSVEELFANVSLDTCNAPADDEMLVVHAATGFYEIGNANLESEKSNNIEIGWRHDTDSLSVEINGYYNKIDDYIFLDITGEEHEETGIAQHTQQDAKFRGLEGELSFRFGMSDQVNGELSVYGDLVDAELSIGGKLPRIPASKFGSALSLFGDNWTGRVQVTQVNDQDDVSRLEMSTEGYTLVTAYLDYDFSVGGDSALKVFLRGDNLLDDQIRNHASWLKNYSPEFGRGVTLGLRYEY